MQVIKLLLLPLSLLYFFILKLRYLLYKLKIFKQNKLPFKVISVGNITLGGSGKTPFVIYLTNKLKSKFNVAVLTRGYKSKSEYKLRILNSDTIPWNEVGDEAHLIFQQTKVPVMVGENRYKNGLIAKERFNSNLALLDDGFQYLELKKDLDIVIIDATNPFGGGMVFPAGCLRDFVSSIKRANLIVISRVDLIKKEMLEHIYKKLRSITDASIFEVNFIPQSIYELKTFKNYDFKEFQSENILFFAGVGNKFALKKFLEKYFKKFILKTFSDHYVYKRKDLEKIFKVAQEQKALIFTTQKDAVKIKSLLFNTDPDIFVLTIKPVIFDEEKFWQCLETTGERR